MSKKIVLIHEQGGLAIASPPVLSEDARSSLDDIIGLLVQHSGITVTISLGPDASEEAEELYFAAEKVLQRAGVEQRQVLADKRKHATAREQARMRMERANWTAVGERFPDAVRGLRKPIDDLEMSVRLMNQLRQAGMYFVWQIGLLGMRNLLARQGFGPKTSYELLEILAEQGVYFMTTQKFKRMKKIPRDRRLSVHATESDLVILDQDWFPE